MTSTETVHIVSTAPKQARATVRGFTLMADKPQEKGGNNEGPMPSELFLAALGTCMSMTFRRIAEARRVPLEHLELVAEMDFSDKGDTTAIRLTARVRSTAAEKDVRKAFDMASDHCTVAQLVRDPSIEKRLELLS
ncbi:MAG TPA: OsmC family protein [Candidatus Thermoplasmatota archaeon]|nr:OsmC family protein [Candidatus Thermoplasmatota archaeon]